MLFYIRGLIHSLGMRYLFVTVKNNRFVNWSSQTANMFLILASCLGLFALYAIPPLWGFDETSHFARVYQISRGQFVVDKSKDQFGGTMPASFNAVSRYATADIGEQKNPDIFARKDLNNREEYQKLLSQKFSSKQEIAINPAGYSPATYPLSELLVGLGRFLHFNIGMTLFLARLGGLITYVTIVYFAIKLLGDLKSRWVVFAVGLSPVMIVQAATLSADSVVNALALLFMSLFILSFVKPERMDRKKLALLGIVAIWMPLIKLNYLFLSFGLLLIPIRSLASRRQSILYRSGFVAVATILGVVWAGLMSVTSTSGVSPRPDGLPINPTGQMHYLLTHPLHFLVSVIRSLIYYGDTYIREAFGILGWNYVVLPLIIVGVTITLIFVAAFYAKDELDKMKIRSYLLGLFCLVGVATIFAILYIGFTPVGKHLVDGVQGRYLLPFLLPLIICVVNLVPARIVISNKAMAASTGIGSGLILLMSLLYYLALTY
jgi:uncharacterized membrane protein